MCVFNIWNLYVFSVFHMSIEMKVITFSKMEGFLSSTNEKNVFTFAGINAIWCQNDVNSKMQFTIFELSIFIKMGRVCFSQKMNRKFKRVNETRFKAWTRCKVCQNVSFVFNLSLVGSVFMSAIIILCVWVVFDDHFSLMSCIRNVGFGKGVRSMVCFYMRCVIVERWVDDLKGNLMEIERMNGEGK